MSKRTIDINYKKKFRFNENQLNYEFQLKRKRNWWWLLLFLLPLLLLIRCEKDVRVQTVTEQDNIPIPDTEVRIDYVAHYLYKDGTFFANIPYQQSQVTDTLGYTTFNKLGCSLYSCLFYCLSEMNLLASSECYDADPLSKIFHFNRNVKIRMRRKQTELPIKVVDAETATVIPGANVRYIFRSDGGTNGEAITNPNGEIMLKNIWECGVIDRIEASAYGYADTIVNNLQVREMMSNRENSTIKLRPIKEKFDFFVKNKITFQPIPGAKVEVMLVDKGTQKLRGESITNVDGIGRGFYDDAFILSKVQIKASKLHYKDGELEGDYTVEEFKKLPDSLRVIYLEPEPYVVEFQNIDTLTNKPIAGVLNEITVNSINGKTESYEEVSNNGGYFPVKAMEGDEISITSSLTPAYKTKNTIIEKYKAEEVIYMEPEVVTLVFRTIDAVDGTLLGDCTLSAFLNSSPLSEPQNSLKGEFMVDDLLVNGTVSITASKQGYKTNNYSVNNALVAYLMKAPQRARDIPLELDLPPCQAGNVVENIQGKGEQIDSYSLGKRGPGTFVFDYYTGSREPDRIMVYNCKEEDISPSTLIFDTGDLCTEGLTLSKTLKFVEPVVTVHAITSSQTSVWSYCVHCPN